MNNCCFKEESRSLKIDIRQCPFLRVLHFQVQFFTFNSQFDKMLEPEFQPRIAYRTLRIIFYSLNTGLLVFFMVGVYLNGMELPPFRDEIDMLTVVNLLLLVSIPAGYMISGRRLEAIKSKDPFPRKFEQFQTAMIIRWAMIEGTALLSIVGLILLQDAKQLVIFVLCILVLSLNTVTRDKVVRMAKLNPEEARALDD